MIATESQHDAALKRIDALWHANQGTPEFKELKILIEDVVIYEEINHPVE